MDFNNDYMYYYHGIPLHPIGLVLVYIIGLIWLMYIAFNNDKFKDEKEKIIDGVYYVYPLVFMTVSTAGLVCLIYMGKFTFETFYKSLVELF